MAYEFQRPSQTCRSYKEVDSALFRMLRFIGADWIW